MLNPSPLFKLPAIHRVPFDRMLVCQAVAEGLTILTPDEAISQYPVRTAWQGSAQIALVLQLEQDLLHRFVDAQMGGIDRQFGFFRHLVGIGDAGKLGD